MNDTLFHEDKAEAANLRARRPFDLAATLIEESTRAAARAVDDLRLTIMKLRSGLTELEREVLETGAAVAAEAAEKAKPQPKHRRATTEIPWCTCGMFTEKHVHHRNHPEPEDVTP